MNKRTVFLAVGCCPCALLFICVIFGDLYYQKYEITLLRPVEKSSLHSTTLKPFSRSWKHTQSLNQKRKRVTVLFRTKFWHSRWFPATRVMKCGRDRSLRCRITCDKRLFYASDAVIFHVQADDLFTSLNESLAMPRPHNQRWVMFNHESPQNTPSLPMNKLNGLINWTVTYMKESDVRYAYYDIKPGVFHGGFDPKRDYRAGRKGMAAILVSNCRPQGRMRWVLELKKYIDVQIYGNCGDHTCSKTNKSKCMSKLQKHKFYLSLENSYCQGYVTEKLYANAFDNEIVPVVLSYVNFSDPSVIPPGSVINALDFPSVKELAKHMMKVGSDSDLYNEYFKWHSKYTTVRHSSKWRWCELCRKLATNRSSKVHRDLMSWYSSKRLCKEYPVPQ